MAEITKPDYTYMWAQGGAVIVPSSAKVQLGWTAEIPPHQWENWAQNRQDQAIKYLFQHGIAEWDEDTEYFAGKSAVLYEGKIYVATANSTDENPEVSPTFWAQVAMVPDISPDVGEVKYFARNTAPSNYLKAMGQAVDRTVYAALDSAIYVGDVNNATAPWGYRCTDSANPNSTRSITGNFLVLPDGRGEFIRGWDDGRGLDPGRAFGSTQLDAFRSHTHTGNTGTGGAHSHIVQGKENESGGGQLAGGSGSNISNVPTSTDGAHTHSLTIDSTGGSETRPHNLALLCCIRYQ